MTKITPEERRASLLERKKKLEDQLKKLDARDCSKKRKADARRKIIVGAICLHHAEEKPEFKKWLSEQIQATQKKPADLALFSDLIDK